MAFDAVFVLKLEHLAAVRHVYESAKRRMQCHSYSVSRENQSHRYLEVKMYLCTVTVRVNSFWEGCSSLARFVAAL